MGYFIPASREENLRKYSYKGYDGSLLSKYILTP
jgi:ethanolaminephosphotransferase